MVDNKREQERSELHRTIWGIANDLRGSVDGWDFKQYVLGMLFYRYISENITAYIDADEHAAGDVSFSYAALTDGKAEQARDDLVKTKGFFILPSELFENVLKHAPQDENLNETLGRVFNHIEVSARGTVSEDDFKGLFDDIDVNSNKLGSTVAKRNEKLVKLMNGVNDMKLGDYKDNTIDAFGDAYEYLMGMYASNAGKSGGEYYTPQEVSELLTRIALVGKTEVNKVYDPACGSGSLLLKFAKILGKENVRQGFFGQEINITTYNLCRINMFLHDIDFDKFDIALGDTLTDPLHWDDEPFEAIVSNPPYSIKWAGDENPLLINDPRFSPAGVLAPKSKADLAFIMHSLSWLATSGTAAIVCFPGILYRGGAERKIRQYLVDNNFIDCVIQLPDNLFFGTSIATCIMVLKKSKAENATLFIDASREFVKVTNSNKLTNENIDRIIAAQTSKEAEDYFSVLVSNDEIAEHDYNLSVSTYVEQEDTREAVNIVELNAEIERIVAREDLLRHEIAAVIAEIEGSPNTTGTDVSCQNGDSTDAGLRTEELLVSAASSIWDGSDVQVSITIAVNERLKAAVGEGTDLCLEQAFITDSDIRHIKKRHGSGQDALGQEDIIPDDFAVIPTVLCEYDEIIRGEDDKMGNARFMLVKGIGSIAYLATIQRGKRKLEIRTFYKRKPGAS